MIHCHFSFLNFSVSSVKTGESVLAGDFFVLWGFICHGIFVLPKFRAHGAI